MPRHAFLFLIWLLLQVLEQLLDRSHMTAGKPAPYGESGVGYEVVQTAEGPGLLSTVE